MRYRPDIDGLRALAVAGVVVFHTGVGILPGGYVGVDIFFVISGYLISAIVAREVEAGTFTFTNFYARRVRRILPALLAVLAGTMVASCIWLLPAELESVSEGMLATLLFVSNFFYYGQVGYFDTAAEFKPLLHTWSLAIEEQFYLFFPLAFVMVARLAGRRGLLLVPLVLSLATLIAAEIAVRTNASAAFFWTPFRVWEFGVGIVLAQSGWRPATRRMAEIGSLAGLVLVLVSMAVFEADTPVPGLMGLIPVLGSALLLACVAPERPHGPDPTTLVARALACRPFVFLGLVSYSLYLWHQPVFAIARLRSAAEPSAFEMLALIGLVVVLAWLTWRFVEQPFRRAESVGTGRFLGATLGSVGMLLAVAIVADDGWRSRFDDRTLEILAGAAQRSDPRVKACTRGNPTFVRPDCLMGPADRPRVALIGDSHAIAIASQLANALEPRSWSLELRARVGCPSIPGYAARVHRADCERIGRQFNTLSPEARVVVVAARWPTQIWQTGFDNGRGGIERLGWDGVRTEARSVEDRVAELSRALSAQIAEHVAAGRRVVVLHTLPEHGWDVPERMARLRLRDGDDSMPLAVPLSRFDTRAAPVARAFVTLPDGPSVLHVKPRDLFCDEERGLCLAERDGLPLYYDDDHLNAKGGAILADAIVTAMTRRNWL